MRGPPLQKALPALLDFYKRDDLPGFIKEWRRLNPGRSGAVQAWIDIAIANGAYDIKEEDP
ncbi:unnamed protein product [marine sediment metagenome]|uniref:Uncharacterized protein n=1 Tax=marine sediment metagenome TaxID=412755 RepID=X1Q0Q0_9ZZZZ